MVTNNGVFAYKVVPADWVCFGLEYGPSGTFEVDGELELCSNGIHFCYNLMDCFNYHDDRLDSHCLLVEPLGDVIFEGDKSCTNKLKVVKELSTDEVIEQLTKEGYLSVYNLQNHGINNHGVANYGSYNLGNSNCGNFNYGDNNKGSYNNGNGNWGEYNEGMLNFGKHIKGICSTRNFHDGYSLFNKKICCENYWDIWNNKVYQEGFKVLEKLANIPICVSVELKEEECKSYIEMASKKRIVLTDSCIERRIGFWNNLSREEKESVYELPNYDEEVFLKCLGLKQGDLGH